MAEYAPKIGAFALKIIVAISVRHPQGILLVLSNCSSTFFIALAVGGGSHVTWIIIGVVLIIVLGAGAFFVLKKKKKRDHGHNRVRICL